MSTMYVACLECKIVRDLDEFWTMQSIETRKEALALAETMSAQHSFSAALLASFLWDHTGHPCTVFCERDEDMGQPRLPPLDGLRADTDYWSGSDEEEDTEVE